MYAEGQNCPMKVTYFLWDKENFICSRICDAMFNYQINQKQCERKDIWSQEDVKRTALFSEQFIMQCDDEIKLKREREREGER